MKFSVIFISLMMMMSLSVKAQEATSANEEALVAEAEKIVTEELQKQNLKESEIPVLQKAVVEKHESSSLWFRLIGSLIFISVMAGGVVLIAKKWSKRKDVGGVKAKIDMLHQFHLGPKKSLALIRVAGETILIGVTDQSINMIKPVALIDDELPDSLPQDFNNFLEDDFIMEDINPAVKRTRSL